MNQRFKSFLLQSFKKYRYHILGWLFFMAYEICAAGIITGSFATVGNYTVHYVINILLFYLHAHFFLPLAFKKRSLLFLALPAILVIEWLCYATLVYGVEYIGIHYFGLQLTRPFVLNLGYLTASVWRFIYFIGLSSAYYLFISLRREQLKIKEFELEKLRDIIEKQKVEKELTESQNAYLRSQINPHLLFNTLSFIYSNVQDASPKASEGIMLLSEVMHYALGQTHEDGRTDLAREVEHIQKYIALNQLRFSKPLQLQTAFEGSFGQHRLPPLLLLTFVENMFKHGILNDPAHPAMLHIQCTPSDLLLFTKNKKRSSFLEKGFGIGMENVKSRLQKLYKKEDYSLNIQQDDLYYQTNLRISLL